MNKNELLSTIRNYEARCRELNDMFMAEKDIEKAKTYLEESKNLAKTIAELQKSYDRIIANEKRNNKKPFVNKIRDIVMGLH